MAGRQRKRLDNAVGLDQFGVNLTTLKPGAWSAQRHWHEVEDELMEVTATDSQSLLAITHNTYYLKRETRPKNASADVRRWHWIGGGLLMLVTLAAAGGRASRSPVAPLSPEKQQKMRAILEQVGLLKS